jgi:methylthioribulose-1-phosphate dehydratase
VPRAWYEIGVQQSENPRAVIVELCRQMYGLGWATGTGGGISVRDGERVYMAPSGVQKERLHEDDIFVLDVQGEVLEPPKTPGLKLSECAPLFFNAYRLRNAGAVLHSHGMYAMLATLLGHGDGARGAQRDVFEITEIEMIKGLVGHGYYDRLVVPIIENTARECELADRMAAAIEAYPQSSAVLVRRHGVYVWGRSYQHAKTQAECYHYLFEASVEMAKLGIDASKPTAARQPRVAGFEGGRS